MRKFVLIENKVMVSFIVVSSASSGNVGVNRSGISNGFNFDILCIKPFNNPADPDEKYRQ